MSSSPVCDDILDPSEAVLDLPTVAERLDVPITKVHQLLREHALLALRRDGIRVVPALLLDGDDVLRWVPGLLRLLADGGYGPTEILRWLYTADESLPGRPIDALHGHGAREVLRRAQAMAF